jgi:simple sugar transport system permease protein
MVPVADQTASVQSLVVSRLLRTGRTLVMPVGSVIFAFIAGAVVIAITKGNPFLAYQALICGGTGLFCFGGENAAFQISNTIVFTTPLILTGLAVAIGFKAGLFNIGAEGQLVMGILASVSVGLKFASWPGWLLLPAVLIAGALAGAAWGGIAGVLKATTGAHEVVTTIMLNYVALWLMRYLIIGGPLQVPHGFSASPPIPPNGQLPAFLPHTNQIIFGEPSSIFSANYGIIVALLAAVVFWFVMRRTALGYEIGAVGQSQKAARYAGVSIRRTVIVTMLISGAFAGLAGAVQIAGVPPHTITDTYFVDTTGFDAIAVALLGLGSAAGVVLAAFLFGALHAGGSVMQGDAQISGNLVFVLEALVLFSLAANLLKTLNIRLPGLGRKPGVAAPAESEAVEGGEELSAIAAAERETGG